MNEGYTAQVRLRYGSDTEKVGFKVQSIVFKVGEFTDSGVKE
jgi:hypothetical protein